MIFNREGLKGEDFYKMVMTSKAIGSQRRQGSVGDRPHNLSCFFTM